jgi:PTH1 family peptidyl-tRNA hydrolase
MFVIAGLGNPGVEYEKTRHNVGFNVVDLFVTRFNLKSKNRFDSIIFEGIVKNNEKEIKVIFVKPQTYMNLSGESIVKIKNWYKIQNGNIIIIYDDFSLQLSKIRIRKKGSSGGHNGAKSVIKCLGTDEFPRIKIGINNVSFKNFCSKNFVLSKFSIEELEVLKCAQEKVVDAVTCVICEGIDSAMNRYNGA